MTYKKFEYFGDGKYEISDEGIFRNSKTLCEYKPNKTENGYFRQQLYYKGAQYHIFNHRAVALTFIPIPEHLKDIPIEELQVNHINQDKTDNRIENLNWMTSKENINWGDGIQRRKEKLIGKRLSEEHKQKISETHKGKPCSKVIIEKLSKPVGQFDKDMNLITTFPSACEAARQLGLTQAGVSNCCRGLLKTHHNYIFRYL